MCNDHHDTEILMFGYCHYCGGTEYAPKRGRHAGTAHGYARDMGAARVRILAGKPRYGKHGEYVARHAGKRESLPAATVREWARAITRRPANGAHGIVGSHPVALGLRIGAAQRKAA